MGVFNSLMKRSHNNIPQISIREFRIEDYDEVLALWDNTGLEYRPQGRDSRQQIADQISQDRVIFLVAETNGQLVGSVLGTHDGRKGWINRLAVDTQHRHHNIARRLVSEVESRLAQLGIEVIACLIEDWNADSMRVFKKLGYERYDVTYYSKRRSQDA